MSAQLDFSPATTSFPLKSRSTKGLKALETLLRRDLELLDYPARDWIAMCPGNIRKDVLDVLIVGGGQGGLAVAFGLMRQKINNILVIDKSPEGYEGPWRTFARMITLRTPKHLTGMDYGIPNLTFRAWYEAQWGIQAWNKLNLIPKETWADYLHWYRKFLEIPVQNESTVGAIEWIEEKGCFAVPVESKEGNKTMYARKVVLATGIDGSGRWAVPKFITKSLPHHLYSHTRNKIDFQALKGKRIGVLGAGASAFDNASVALENEAAEVRLFFRRKELPRVNPYRWAEFVGFLNHHSDLSDAERWRFVLKILRMGQLPPADTFERASKFTNFHLQPDSEWQKVEQVGEAVRVTTQKETFEFDFLIIATGFVTDLSLRPELAKLHRKIALWKDRYTPPEPDRHQDLCRHPYLGPGFELQEKEPGQAPYLKSIINYTFGCLPSNGFGGASISGMKYSLPRVVNGITRQLYADSCADFYDTLEAFDIKDF